jgi:ATP adenylyltransferase
MDNLWAAWRRDFILGPREKGCVFCNRIKKKSDRANLILYRAEKSIVFMNKYPYNVGHLLVLPGAHKGDIQKLTESEWIEMNDLTRKSLKILKDVMPTKGFNIGMNLGAVAGAGIKEHIHIHIVPRFLGDANFMCTVGNSRVQSFSLEEVYDMLRPGFDHLRGPS